MTIKLITFENKQAIIDDDEPTQKPIFVDFNAKSLRYRLTHGGGSKQMLAKAIGVKPGFRPSVVDCTAGLGKDAFILASLGCKVLMIEKHPVVGQLLVDGLMRGQNTPGICDICANLSLSLNSAEQELPQIYPRPETIYIDPMFPPRTKSAKVKKEMQWLQRLVGKDEDASALLVLALNYAQNRVVIKRPINAPPLNTLPVSFQFTGKANRFDIYLIS